MVGRSSATTSCVAELETTHLADDAMKVACGRDVRSLNSVLNIKEALKVLFRQERTIIICRDCRLALRRQ